MRKAEAGGLGHPGPKPGIPNPARRGHAHVSGGYVGVDCDVGVDDQCRQDHADRLREDVIAVAVEHSVGQAGAGVEAVAALPEEGQGIGV